MRFHFTLSMARSRLLGQMDPFIFGIEVAFHTNDVQGQRFKTQIEGLWSWWCRWDHLINSLLRLWPNFCVCCFLRLVKGTTYPAVDSLQGIPT